MDAGGMTSWMREVESRLEQRSRAMHGAIAENTEGTKFYFGVLCELHALFVVLCLKSMCVTVP
jgi:hypothetical protein